MKQPLELQQMHSDGGAIDIQPVVSTAKVPRIAALDFTKGALVLFMVLYHWINYFIGSEWPYYRYLRFLTPSFIFITGFMISNVYLSKYEVTDPRLLKRLVVRGFKLVIIFTVLNLARDCVRPLLSGGDVDFSTLHLKNIQVIFLTGDFTSKIVAFYILVPIAYLLVLSGLLMLPRRKYKYTFQAFSAFLFLLLATIDLSGRKNQNLEILAIGMLGILVGFKRIEIINRVIRHPYLLAFAYLLYTIAITIWNVPYPFEIVGTCLTVTIIYLVGTIDWRLRTIQGKVIHLGKYSLFGYIAQIAILQILEAGLRHVSLNYATLFISLVVAVGLTVMSVEMVDRARKGASLVDGLYKVLFN